VIFFTAERVERVGLNEVVVTKGKFTACDETVPKWSFTADEARITTNDRIKLKNGKFRVLDVTILPIPYASIPIKKQDRASGFLTPTFGFPAIRERVFRPHIIKTLDVRGRYFSRDIYSARGVGFGMDVRTRANSRSF
jgi:LPS-assembly protein